MTAFLALALMSPGMGQLVRERLDLARPVALAKLYARAPIEDRVRERAVLDGVRAQAHAYGVEPERATRFFRDQIEASKLAQAAWQREWHRQGAPFDPRPNLARDVRPKLDRLTPELLRALRTQPEHLDRWRPREPFLLPAWRRATRSLIRADLGAAAKRVRTGR